MTTTILVNRHDLADARIETHEPAPLGPGQVRAKTGHFALTANNVTYGIAGEMAGYWRYFPADAPDGVIPVWGFATIVESLCPEIPEGTEIWGYLPVASDVVLQPGDVRDTGFMDLTAHRQGLPPVYNHYALTSADSEELKAAGDARSLFFPLLMTGYVLADWLEDQDYRGADQIVVSSASSKTGYALAFCVGARRHTIGLTSERNLEFVKRLGCFQEAFSYDEVESVDAGKPTIFLDMAGSVRVTQAVHAHFGDRLKASVAIGLTHWQDRGMALELPGPEPEFFFVPDQIAKRDREWGTGELRRRADAASVALLPRIEERVNVRRLHGADHLLKGWVDLVKGRIPPAWGLVGSF
jgi:hypothetical protein